MGPTESRPANPARKAAAAAGATEHEREEKFKARMEEEVAAALTREVKIVEALQLEGDPGAAGAKFEVWSVDERRCLVVAHPNSMTAKLVVCMGRADWYLVKYFVKDELVDQRKVETEQIALAFESALESGRV